MSSMFRCFALLAALILAPVAANAQDGTPAQADRLMEVMRARETVDAILPQIQMSQQQMLAQLTAGQEIEDAERARLTEVLQTSNARIVEALSWERLAPIYRDIYLKTFTAEDMDAMIGFYSSEAGQKLLDRLPQLMQHTMEAVQTLVMPMLQQMEQDIRETTAAE